MANIFQSHRLQFLATCITAFAFTCVTIAAPLPLMAIDMSTQKNGFINQMPLDQQEIY